MNIIPTNAEVGEIAALAKLQLSLVAQQQELELELKGLSEKLRRVQEIDLPAAMQQAGVSEIKLPDGYKITVKEDVYASIPAENKDGAFEWLREHGFGDLIKNEVAVSFGKGEEDQAASLLRELDANGWRNYQQKTAVHPQTLKALVREQLAKGAEFPMDLFGAGPITKAIIK